jgi:SAM-dependent methyltransferase
MQWLRKARKGVPVRWRKRLFISLRTTRNRLLGIPATGTVNFGDLRHLQPVSRHFGTDRGRPLDRHYIEGFLAAHSQDIRGRVLEVGDSEYTSRFGGSRVLRSDVLHVDDSNPRATIVADLADAPHIDDASFDCIVLTQVLHLIYDARSAVRTLHRILKPGGVLLLTTPGLSPVPQGTVWAHTWYWSFTELSVRRMLEEAFRAGNVVVQSNGNVLAAMVMLQGLAAEDIDDADLDFNDPDYPVILAARAQKPATGS